MSKNVHCVLDDSRLTFYPLSKMFVHPDALFSGFVLRMKISWGCKHDYRNFHSRSDTEWISIAPWIYYQFQDEMLDTNTQHYHGNKRTVTSQQAQSLLWGASLRTTVKWMHAPQAVCASMALSSFLGPDGRGPHPVSLPKQRWWFTGIYDRDVRGYLTGEHAFSRLTSLTKGCVSITMSSCGKRCTFCLFWSDSRAHFSWILVW